jgi:hypothetical protein
MDWVNDPNFTDTKKRRMAETTSRIFFAGLATGVIVAEINPRQNGNLAKMERKWGVIQE